MSTDMREAMEAAFEEAENAEEKEETGGPDEGATESLGAAATGEEEPAGGEEELSGGTEGEGEGEPGAGEPLPVSADAGGDADPPGDDAPAPVSWKPEIREHWAGLPPEVKGEIQRREADITRSLNDGAGHRKLAQEYHAVISPFAQYIQAAGSTPGQAVTNLLQTATQLTTGSASMKAEVVRNIIKEYGVDIGMLDTILSGEPVPDDPNAALLNSIDERLGPINDFMGSVHQGRADADSVVTEGAMEELGAFQQSHSEFYEDLREDMADLLEMNANRGRAMTMEEAYERASQAHPSIGPILQQRAEAAAGKLSTSAANKKRHAASSVTGSQGGVGGDPGGEGSMRGTIESLWDDSGAGVEH